MNKNMNTWIEEIISNKKVQAMPIMTYPGLEFIDKGVIDIVTNGNMQYECIKALADKYPSIAAVTIMDLSVEAEAFGAEIKFSNDEVPDVSSNLINNIDEAKALEIPKVGSHRTTVYLEATKLMTENILDRPSFAGQIGPFSLTARLLGVTDALMQIMLEPELVHILLEKTTKFLIEYAKAFKEHGAHGIIIAEPVAGLLSPDLCDEFSSKYVKQIVDSVQDDNFIVILHNCGNTTNLIPSMLSTGSKLLHLGNAVDLTDILPQVPSDIIVSGNIDPATIFRNGTIEDVKNETNKLLNETANYNNFIISSGCDIPPNTPIKNIDAFFNSVEEYNK